MCHIILGIISDALRAYNPYMYKPSLDFSCWSPSLAFGYKPNLTLAAEFFLD